MYTFYIIIPVKLTSDNKDCAAILVVNHVMTRVEPVRDGCQSEKLLTIFCNSVAEAASSEAADLVWSAPVAASLITVAM